MDSSTSVSWYVRSEVQWSFDWQCLVLEFVGFFMLVATLLGLFARLLQAKR